MNYNNLRNYTIDELNKEEKAQNYSDYRLNWTPYYTCYYIVQIVQDK